MMYRFYFLLFLLFVACKSVSDEPVLLPNVVVPKVLTIEKITDGLEFPEGPVWCWDEEYLLFSDINADAIYKWTEKDGITPFLLPSANSNGIAYNGREFFVCRHGGRDLICLEKDGSFEELVSRFEGKKLNSPNDICVGNNDNLYFSDPDYGVDFAAREISFEGVYMFNSDNKEIRLVDSTLVKPNGLTLNPNRDILYVCESSSNSVFCYRLDESGFPVDRKLFCMVPGKGEVDGISCHASGYVFVAFGDGGVVFISPQGEIAGSVQLPPKEKVRNVCFGGEKENVLYVTAGKSLYRILFLFEPYV